MLRASTTQCFSANEGRVPHDVDRCSIETNDHPLEREGNTTDGSVLHHNDAVSDGKDLPLKTIDGVDRFK